MGHDHNHDELRSLAMGWLARPLDLLKLLVEHTEHTEHTDTSPSEAPAWAPDHLADTVDRLCSLSSRKLAKLRGRGRSHVHITDDALRTGTGVARIEGVGPIDLSQLQEVLGHADVTVTPVLYLRMRRRDGVDYDHAIPYDDTCPPGQNGPHNSGPRRRRHHRTKTHGGLTTRVVGPGRHLWRTPYDQAFLVDHSGTTRLTAQQAAAMAEAVEDGVELYFT